MRILLTPGEPAGIGPELAVKIAQSEHAFELCAVADPRLLEDAAKQAGLALSIRLIKDPTQAPRSTGKCELACLPVELNSTTIPGKLNPKNAQYVLQTLQLANDWCLANHAQAVVTGPVQKSIINDAGIPFSGHTEFFAEQSRTPKVVMMLAAKELRVALATTHLPLNKVSEAITKPELISVCRVLHRALKEQFAIDEPRILVCGLNPHAGEGGHLGMEEIETITPVLDELRAEGMDFIGPLPADTLFTPHHLQDADAALAMFHDQGLPVLKHYGFGEAVNITLGLPYIRTSVDHGTALDIAGQNIADCSSLNVAVKQAYTMAEAKQHDR